MRIPHWREDTGCRNVKPFKYSGEHFSGETSASASSHLNATLNEVLTSYEAGGGGEVLDQKEEPLDLSGLRSLPAYRYKPGVQSVHTGRVKTGKSRKEARKKLKLERRRERRRRLRAGQGSLAASYAGLTLHLAGGERKRLQGGGGRGGRGGSVRPQPPPFDMLLSSVEDSQSVVPHSSGEVRTDTTSSDSDGRHLTFSELPSHRSRPPPPLRDSQTDQQHHQQQLRNYKRRRHQS